MNHILTSKDPSYVIVSLTWINSGKPDLFIIQYCDWMTMFQLSILHSSMQSKNGFVRSDSLSADIDTNFRSKFIFSLTMPIQDVPK